MGYPLWKNVNCSTFWTFCFYSLERFFFVLEYRKRHFPGLYCLKKNFGKMAIFGPNTMGYPLLKNVNFSTFWTFFFYRPERRFSIVKNRKRHFPGLYCVKKKFWKMAIFGPKGWVNFSTFSTSCFYSLERPFFVLEYRKRHFPGLYCLKKKCWKNGHFLTKTMG